MEIPISKLQNDIEVIVTDLGYQLYDIEQETVGSTQVLRVLVQRGENESVDLDDCVKISHGLTPKLDNDPNLVNEYTLEVASPGIIRPLRTDNHLQQVIGQTILVKTKKKLDGFESKNIESKLLSFSDSEVVLEAVAIDRNVIKGMETTFEF